MPRTRFGVVIPLWRPNKRGKCLTLEFVLTGLIPSKKNRQRASFNYSWAIAQVKGFFREHKSETVSTKEVVKFLVNLIKNIKPFIYKPQEIVDWETAAKTKLVEQAAIWKKSFSRHDLSYPISSCSILIHHYWKDEYQRDNSNREQTIHDILVDAGIIVDDNSKCLFRNTSEADCFKDEIVDHVTTIKITAYSW